MDMNKQELFDAFDQDISKKSIVRYGDKYVIQGKFCVIAPLGGNKWDVWICNQKEVTRGLGSRKVTNITTVLLKSYPSAAWTELTGEAYGVSGGYEIDTRKLKNTGNKKEAHLFSRSHIENESPFNHCQRGANSWLDDTQKAKVVLPTRLFSEYRNQSWHIPIILGLHLRH